MKTAETKSTMVDNPAPRRISDGCGGYDLWRMGGGGSAATFYGGSGGGLYNAFNMDVRMDGDDDER